MSVHIFTDDDRWQEIGSALSGAVTLSSDIHQGDRNEGLYADYQPRWITPMETTISFPITSADPRTLEVIFDVPFHPIKRRELTGKAYRQACRAYQRRLKAFKRGRWGWRGVT